MGAFDSNIGSYDNRLPGSKANQPNGFAAVVFPFMNADM